jgi:sugar phosphate isomerase/epimerase
LKRGGDTAPSTTPTRRAVVANPLSMPTWGLADQLALAAALGLSHASVTMGSLAATGSIGQGARLVAASGLQVAVVYPSSWFDLADRRSWPEGRDQLSQAVDVAAELEAGGVLLTGGSAGGMRWDEAVGAFAEAVEPVRQRAARGGVPLLLEAVRPQFANSGFIHSLRDAIPVAESMGFELVVDLTHCWWEPGIDDILEARAELIGTVHVADLRLDRPVVARVVPGDGHLPLGRLVGALERGGYEGPYELELIGPAIEEEGVASAMSRAVAHLEGLLSA